MRDEMADHGPFWCWQNPQEAAERIDALAKALAGMLDSFGGYSTRECDAAITVMQNLGLDRWSMQASMETSAINASVTPGPVGQPPEGK